MKHIFTFAVVFAACIALYGQDNLSKAKEKLEKIRSMEDVATSWKTRDSTIRIRSFSSDDTTKLAKQILTRNHGEIFTMEHNAQYYTLHKILDTYEIRRYRVQFILLADDQFNNNRIDNVKNEIQSKLSSGISFVDLASEMAKVDSNRSGDSGWFDHGQIYSEFEDAVKSHSFGDVFFVDVPIFQRYYLVKNAFKPQVARRMTTVFMEVPY